MSNSLSGGILPLYIDKHSFLLDIESPYKKNTETSLPSHNATNSTGVFQSDTLVSFSASSVDEHQESDEEGYDVDEYDYDEEDTDTVEEEENEDDFDDEDEFEEETFDEAEDADTEESGDSEYEFDEETFDEEEEDFEEDGEFDEDEELEDDDYPTYEEEDDVGEETDKSISTAFSPFSALPEDDGLWGSNWSEAVEPEQPKVAEAPVVEKRPEPPVFVPVTPVVPPVSARVVEAPKQVEAQPMAVSPGVVWFDGITLNVFLRKNPTIRMESEVKKYFPLAVIREEVDRGKVMLRKGKLIL